MTVSTLLTKEVLEDLYITQRLSMTAIAKRFGCCQTTVRNAFRRHGLIPRTESPKRLDLIGKRFGKLTVIRVASRTTAKRLIWECKCDCGNIKNIAGVHLTRRETRGTRSCGCLYNGSKTENLSARRFGKLTVLSQAPFCRYKVVRWNCLCDCGQHTVATSGNLKQGTVRSCGCLRRLIGPNARPWKGGTHITSSGYRMIRRNKRYIPEHRAIMEDHLGRPLSKTENVHHKNGIRTDNRLENLELWVKYQPCGQRVPDIIDHAVAMLRQYAPDKLALDIRTEHRHHDVIETCQSLNALSPVVVSSASAVSTDTC